MTAVLRTGRRRRTPRLVIFWRRNDVGHPRLAVVVPRHGHPVVSRNRLRRRLREIARRRVLPTLAPLDLVVRSRSAAYTARVDQLVDDLDRWVRSLSG